MMPLFDLGDELPFHADFTLSITKVLGDQLAVALSSLGRTPLSEASLRQLRERAGIYQLYFCGELVYVGKAEKTLPGRLEQHMRKLSGRKNISLDDMTFCCLYVAEDFSAPAPEKLLIKQYDQSGQAPWNHNGFGNRDPGRRRDHTVISVNHFDKAFPADLDTVIDGLLPGSMPMKTFLKKVNKGLHFTFRYAAKELGKPADIPVSLETGDITADHAFALMASLLSSGWQVVALLGYVIMYPRRTRRLPERPALLPQRRPDRYRAADRACKRHRRAAGRGRGDRGDRLSGSSA
jgi:hypothetical protein